MPNTIKIFFAPTNWNTTPQIMEDSRPQSPLNSCKWLNVEATGKIEEADYLIIQDTCPPNILNRFTPAQRLYFSREALTPHLINNYPTTKVNRFSYWDGSGHLWTRWWYGSTQGRSSQGYGGINKTYDELLKESPVPKTNLLTSILSNKTMCEGHKLRIEFTRKFLSAYPTLHLYGSVNFRTHQIPHNLKHLALDDYKFCLGFDNQDNIGNFFGTQFTDSLLRWCVPIFWCGADLKKHFPPKSFIQFDARNPNEINRIIDILNNEDYEDRLEDLTEARHLILNKYNMWPTIKEAIDKYGKQI
jgi:hypothetical protein